MTMMNFREAVDNNPMSHIIIAYLQKNIKVKLGFILYKWRVCLLVYLFCGGEMAVIWKRVDRALKYKISELECE